MRQETPVICFISVLQTHVILIVQFIERVFQPPFNGNYSSIFQVTADDKQIFAEHKTLQQSIV